MTVSAQTPLNRSVGNGVTTVFAYNFKVLTEADMEVSVDGVVKTLTTDYTLSGVGTDSGNVTFVVAPAVDTVVVRRRNMAYTRSVDYQDQGELPTDTLDDDQDAAVLMCQQLAEGLSRAVQVPVDETTDPADLIDSLLTASAAAVAAAATADTDADDAAASAAAAAASAASTGLPALTGKALNLLRVKADETGYETRTPTEALSDIGGLAATSRPFTGVRQTVQSGSVDSSGLPNFLTTAASLNLPIAATSSNLVISAAGGFNLNGPVDRIGIVTADTTLALANSSSLYIYADVSAAGVVTFGSTTLAPSYITGGTPSTTNGQFTFDTTKKIAYVGNGSAAVQSYRVFIGEAVTAGGVITSVINYALNGEYAQVDSGIPTNSRLSKSHNIGVLPRVASIMLRCTTSDAGYAVGEDASIYYSNGNVGTSSQTAYTIGIIFNVGTIAVVNKTSGSVANIATGQWDTAFYANRGW